MKVKLFITQILIIIFILSAASVYSQVGKSVSPIKLKNVQDNETTIPNIGKKVVVIFYLDPDVQEVNDPLSDVLDKEQFPVDKFSAIGIVNCKDTWLPNAGIRAKAKSKQEHFPKSIILLDEENSLANAWKLKNCDDRLIVLIIGTDSKVKYLKALSSIEESKAYIPEFIKSIKDEIAINNSR
jgi:predicted transcriptional regulator